MTGCCSVLRPCRVNPPAGQSTASRGGLSEPAVAVHRFVGSGVCSSGWGCGGRFGLSGARTGCGEPVYGKWVSRTMMPAASMRVVGRMLVPALAALAVSCGSGQASDPLVVGAQDVAQSRVLAEIYAQALARTGASVRVEPGLPGRVAALEALAAGTVTVAADHNGALLGELNTGAAADTVDAVTAELNGSLPQ